MSFIAHIFQIFSFKHPCDPIRGFRLHKIRWVRITSLSFISLVRHVIVLRCFWTCDTIFSEIYSTFLFIYLTALLWGAPLSRTLVCWDYISSHPWTSNDVWSLCVYLELATLIFTLGKSRVLNSLFFYLNFYLNLNKK